MCRPVPSRPRSSSQTWRTFLRNHAGEILACDFFVTVTATFRLVYVFLVLDIDTRRILHWNVTEHPTAEWTVQQFRACLTGDEPSGSSFTTATASIRRPQTERYRQWDFAS
jgi:putative transposase